MDDAEFPAAYAEIGTSFWFNNDNDSAVLVEVPVGRLRFPTGDVVADDPTYERRPDESELVFCSIPLGTYEVSLLMLNFETGDVYPNVTGVKLHVQDGVEVKTWEGARISPNGGVACFGVDAGTGCLVDRSFLPMLEGEAFDELDMEDQVDQALETGWASIPADTSEFDLLLYSCGMGDGAYPLYLGLDENGEIATVLVDLELLRHGERQRSSGLA